MHGAPPPSCAAASVDHLQPYMPPTTRGQEGGSGAHYSGIGGHYTILLQRCLADDALMAVTACLTTPGHAKDRAAAALP